MINLVSHVFMVVLFNLINEILIKECYKLLLILKLKQLI